MDGYGILVNGQVKEVSLLEWAQWLQSDKDFSKRRVARTILPTCEVSTVFLGSDHSFGHGEPLWFETLVFGGRLDQEMDRYTTLDDALQGHESMVARVCESEGKP